jgi:hypothetical protein
MISSSIYVAANDEKGFHCLLLLDNISSYICITLAYATHPLMGI